MVRFIDTLRSLDWILGGAALLLVLVGLAMLFSANYTEQGITSGRLLRQTIALGVALVAATVAARVPYHVVRRYVPLLYGTGLATLVAVLISAEIVRGTVSRFSLLGVQLQPSEFMKVALVLMLAWQLARVPRLTLPAVLVATTVVGLPVGLILLEPDLGVAALFLAVWVGLLVFRGLPWLALVALGGLAAAGTLAGWRWLFAEYQRQRLLVFLDPTRDPLGAGYNVLQSIVALGSGRWFGRGLGHGPQSQLKFLPEQHTDFILASIGEELGFVGVAVVLVLYGIVLWRILGIAQRTEDPFGQLVCVGTFLVLLGGLTVSAGMNMGLLPVTGIPLPLVSYGGSSLVATFLLLGLVQSVHVYSKWVQRPPLELAHLT